LTSEDLDAIASLTSVDLDVIWKSLTPVDLYVIARV
jgi:hypothetical protein